MAKDPAFLFYSQDFIVGIQTLNFEDRGKYITLLAQMHQQGRMNEETIRFLVGNVSVNLKNKFRIDEKGLWYNERLELEAKNRNRFTESRRINGLKGGRPKKKLKPKGKATKNHKGNLMGNENEIEIEIENEIEILDKNECAKNIILPWDSEEFRSQWYEWKDYRHKEHNFKYNSPQSEQAALRELARLANNNLVNAIEILHKTMANGWKGFVYGSKILRDEKNYKNHDILSGAEKILRKYQ